MPTTIKRSFTIGPPPNLPRTALKNILTDIVQSNGHEWHLVSWQFVGNEVELTYELIAKDPVP